MQYPDIHSNIVWVDFLMKIVILVAFSQIIELVDDAVIISEIDLDDYLEHKFIPYVQQFYQGTSSGPDDMNSLVMAIINAIKEKGTSVGDVSVYYSIL